MVQKVSLLMPGRPDPTVACAVVPGLMGASEWCSQLCASVESEFATLGTPGGFLDAIGGWSEKGHDVAITEERASVGSFWR